MSLTTAGKNASSSTTSTTVKSPILIRPARFSDVSRMGWIASVTYNNTPLTELLTPHRDKYWDDYVRGYRQRVRTRMLSPRSAAYVAVEASNPSVVIGYVQYMRFGEDEGAKRQIASRWSLWLWFLGWWFFFYLKVYNWAVGAGKCESPEGVAKFLRLVAKEGNEHWTSHPSRVNRWHTQSCVVLKEFHRRGVGRLLITEGIKKAEADRVCLGLEASKEGELLYRSVGFKLIARFSMVLAEEERDTGGIMIYTPAAVENAENQ